MKTERSLATRLALACLFVASATACAAEGDEGVATPEEDLRAELALEQTFELPLGAPFDEGEGLHNQAHVFDGTAHFSAGTTNTHQGWTFIHSAEGELVCASRVDDPFGPASTGKVHPGGGLVVDGGLLTAVSNEEDGEGGAVALLRVERPADKPRTSASAAGAPPCKTTWLPIDGKGGRAAVVGEYVGLVTEAAVPDAGRPLDLVLLNIHGARALRYDAPAGRLEAVGTERPRKSDLMPQQCARSGNQLVCTPLPLVGGLALQVTDLTIGKDGALHTLGKKGFGALRAPLGEGISFHDGRVYLAGNARLGESAGCGFAGLAMPCSTQQGGQRIYVYRGK